MRRTLLKLPLLPVVMLASRALRAAVHERPTLAFCAITTTTVMQTKLAWDPFFEAMRNATGLDVRGIYPATYEDAVDAVVTGLAQVAWVSNKAALDCIERANVEVFAQLVDASGALGYRALIVSRQNAPPASIEQVLNRPRTWRFAMGGPASVSGAVMPEYALFVPRAIRPEEHFTTLQRGTHADNIDALLQGRVQACTYNTEELQRLRREAPERAAQLRILWESSLIPKDPLLWRRDLPLSVRKRLADFVFSVGKTEDEKLLLKRMFDLAGFQRSTNQQLRFMLDIEDFKERAQLLLDAKMTEDQKSERLADLRERYTRLSRAIQPPIDATR